MIDESNGICQSCGGPPTKKGLVVDHCHNSGKVRGLLCNSCNTSLGLLKENPENIIALLNYIKRHKN